MRVIKKEISLEPMTSRLPGVVPAYIPGTNTPIYFDEESLEAREYKYPSNYGLIPMSVKITDSSLIESIKHNDEWLFCEYNENTKECNCIIPRKREDDEEECCVALSWETISDWYHFFTDYFHLLNDWGHCGIAYSSATEYYKHESKNGYAGQMMYGSLEQTYIDLDRTYKERGGKIKLDDEYKPKKENGHYVDDGMFKEICDKYIPSMDIPKDYVDYWHTTKLFYPDYIKWRGWFTDRYPKYKEYDFDIECSGATDCCDCAEYFNRGGNEMYEALTSAVFDIPSRETTGFCTPNMMIPVSVQTSIDDMGQFSIFSEEYKLGKDYRTARYGDNTNTQGGTVVSISGNSMILEDGNPGFDFDPEYMEKYFNPDQWRTHKGDISWYVCKDCGYISVSKFSECPICHKANTSIEVAEEDEHTRYYQSGITFEYYAFADDYRKVCGDTEADVRRGLIETYKVDSVDAILANNALIPVEEEEYGWYGGNSGNTYYVYRDPYTETPYTVINGKKIFADIRPQNVDKYFYFPFFMSGTTPSSGGICNYSKDNIEKYQMYPRTRNSAATMVSFINYAGGLYAVEDSGSGVTINEGEYPRVTGTFANEDGNFYIISGNVYGINDEEEFDIIDKYTYDSGSSMVSAVTNEDVKVYSSRVLRGKTSSKLLGLESRNMLVDDVGNIIEGIYNIPSGKTNHQPPEGEILDLVYQVGNTSRRLDKISGLTTDDINASVNYFYGDIITGMHFYFKDKLGNKWEETDWNDSSLATISDMDYDTATSAAMSSYTSLEEGIYCDIEYHIGATLKRENGSSAFTLAEGDFNPGVTYTETVKFVNEDVQYVLEKGIKGQIPTTKNSVSGNNLSYPVTIFKLVQETNDDGIVEADFEMTFPPSTGWSGYTDGLQIFPVFRQEYQMGNSVMEKVESDIYIDRGINAAFEKHIKLGEVTSMEALEQYGNGYFKFQE